MTVPSERDEMDAYEKWASENEHQEHPASIFGAGWDAALEAQHTRDEETRAEISDEDVKARARLYSPRNDDARVGFISGAWWALDRFAEGVSLWTDRETAED